MSSPVAKSFINNAIHHGFVGFQPDNNFGSKSKIMTFMRKEVYDHIRMYGKISDDISPNETTIHSTPSLLTVYAYGQPVVLISLHEGATNFDKLQLIWCHNERNRRKIKCIGHLQELCEKGSPKKFIPNDLVRYIMELV